MKTRNAIHSAMSLLLMFVMPMPSSARTLKFPSTFAVRGIATNSVTIHVRSGGGGPAMLLLQPGSPPLRIETSNDLLAQRMRLNLLSVLVPESVL